MPSDLIILLPPANPAKIDISAVDTGTALFSIEAQGFGSYPVISSVSIPWTFIGIINAR